MTGDPHTSQESQGFRTDRWRVGLLGLNAWVLLVAIPIAWVVGWRASILAGFPLVALGVGLVALPARMAWARAVLLAVYPAALGVAIALHPQLVARDAYGPVVIGLGTAALLAYLAAAAHAVSRIASI